MYIFFYIYFLKVSRSSAEGDEAPRPGEKTASLLIVFATATRGSESPINLFSLRETKQKQSFCLLSPWQLSEGLGMTLLVFLKVALWGLLGAALFCPVMLRLRLYV